MRTKTWTRGARPSEKMKLRACAIALLCAFGLGWAAEKKPGDPLADALFPPELVLQRQSEISLSDQQREAIMSEVQKAQERFTEMQGRLQKEVEALSAILQKDRVDEKAALAQFDKLQAQEREIKRTQLQLVIGIKNKLTAEQQAKLQGFKKQMAAGDQKGIEQPMQVVRQKLEKVKGGVEEWQNSGRDPSVIAEIMQEFQPLMKEGKFKEAEGVLDRALKALGGGKE